MVALSVAPPKDASVVFNVCAASVTSTTSFEPITESAKLIVAGSFTSSSADFDWLPNPGAVTTTVYFAGGICCSWYSPSPFEVVTIFCPVAGAFSVIVAPGTTAPLGSLTTPRNDVVAFCAKPVAVQRENKNKRANTPMRLIKSFLQRDNSLTRPTRGSDKLSMIQPAFQIATESRLRTLWMPTFLQQGERNCKISRPQLGDTH